MPGEYATAPEDLRQRFQQFADLLDNRGVYAGTSHKRISIPKTKMTDEDLQTLGFQSVNIAIPEAGQDRFRSYRHPENLYHLHSHPEHWTMHRDEHPAATMLIPSLGHARAMVQGIPHVLSEGVPGLFNYVGGRLRGRDSTARVVESELPEDVKAMMANMPDSTTLPLAKAAGLFLSATALAKFAAFVATRQQKERRGFHRVRAPGFLDTNGSFDAATTKNEKSETKLAVDDALAKFGLLRRKDTPDNPVDDLTGLFRAPTMDFGRGPAPRMRSRQGQGAPVWGGPAGLASTDGAGALAQFNTPSYGGV